MSSPSGQKNFRGTLRSKQKSSLSTGNLISDPDVAKMQNDFHFTDLVQGFNKFVNNFNKIEVKTKYPRLFMWSQGVQRFRKIDVADETMDIIKKLEERRLEEPKTKKINLRLSPTKEHKSTSQDDQTRIESDAPLEPNSTTKDYSARKSMDERSSPTISNKNKKMNLTATSTFYKPKAKKPALEFKPTDLTKFDFSLPIRPRTTLNVTKIQTETLLKSIGKSSKPGTAQPRFASIKTPKYGASNGFEAPSTKKRSVPNIEDNEYLLNHFDRRNIQVNKILAQIKPDHELLDKEEIIRTTISKIDKATKAFKSARGLQKKKGKITNTVLKAN